MKKERIIPIGARVRAKIPTMGGWKGTGTVIGTAGGSVEVLPDGKVYSEARELDRKLFCSHEVAIMRDQTPNPAHKAPS